MRPLSAVVMVAHIGSSQSEREKVNRGIGEKGSRDLICMFLTSQGHVTFVTVIDSNQSERSILKLLPSPPEVTARPEVTAQPEVTP